MFIWLTFVAGVVYPLFITVISHLTMPQQASGSFVEVNGRIVGSSCIGQKFTKPEYFWPRPSATDYNGLASGGSNLGPLSFTLRQQVQTRRLLLMKACKVEDPKAVPPDLLFASGSGIDPHISVEAALFQVRRIVDARKLDASYVKILENMIQQSVHHKPLGCIGDAYVNVLELNVMLDYDTTVPRKLGTAAS